MRYITVFIYFFLCASELHGMESLLGADPEFWLEEARTQGCFHNCNSSSGVFRFISAGRLDQKPGAISAMCEAIKRNPPDLKVIVLFSLYNIPDVDDFLSRSLMEALASNNTVVTLNFTNASKNTAHYFSDCLKTNNTLKRCCFSDNRFDDEGCLAIAQVIGSNTIVNSLDFRGCKASMKARSAIREAAQLRSENNKLEILF